MKLFILISIVVSTSVFAGEEKTIDQMLGSLKLERMQAESMIAKMQKSGRMNAEEAARVKREIASVKEADVEQIKGQAIERLDSKNSFATK